MRLMLDRPAAAEWEPQQHVWLAWPTGDFVAGQHVSKTTRAVAKALDGRVSLDWFASFAAIGPHLDRLPVEGLWGGSPSEIWIRDYGPLFTHPSRVVRFGFDYWGYGSTGPGDEVRLQDRVARVAPDFGWQFVRSELVGEAGNRDLNGEGLMLAIEPTELRRNPGWTRERLEDEYRRCLGVDQVVWLPCGVAEDDSVLDGPVLGRWWTCFGTGGHVDNVARFVSPDTVALAWPMRAPSHPIEHENARRLEAVRAAIEDAGLEVIEFPLARVKTRVLTEADPLYGQLRARPEVPDQGDLEVVAAGSYLNFLISNGVVLSSLLRDRELDTRSFHLLRHWFPGRQIVQIRTEPINWGGGGIHCMTMNRPC